MDGSRATPGIIDVHGVDDDQFDATLYKIVSGIFSQVWEVLEVLVSIPVGVPDGMHQYSSPSQFLAAEDVFFQAEDGIRDLTVTGVQTCALPISASPTTRQRSPVKRASRSRPSSTYCTWPRPCIATRFSLRVSIHDTDRPSWRATAMADRKSVV